MTTSLEQIREQMTTAYRMDETACIEHLLPQATMPDDMLQAIQARAHALVMEVRKQRIGKSGVDAFMSEYDLSSEEGIALMCLAEALLRVPDSKTIDKLIHDKLTSANWQSHLGQSDSFFVNAATWGLMLTGKVLSNKENDQSKFRKILGQFFSRSSEPVIRTACGQAMKILGHQFVMGRTIQEALKRGQPFEARGYRYSFDMLGEAARTRADAERYFMAYCAAIDAIGLASNDRGIITGPGISVKLSALHPRYEFGRYQQVLAELTPKVLDLAQRAKQYNIGFTIDAEEAERLELSLDIIANVFRNPVLRGYEGFGLAVQAYQKRAFWVIDWLAELAKEQGRKLMVRLVKGAYWDSEIKLSQIQGQESYPVFTRKASTDVSYLACAKKMLSYRNEFYPQFATHNAYTVAAIQEMAGERQDFEFQCLHGMGYALYDQLVELKPRPYPCRIYAPVGSHEDLLPYLVRRLLENGANTSFVNRIVDASLPIKQIIADPVAKIAQLDQKPHPQIPLPRNLYGSKRLNSKGLDLTNRHQIDALAQEIAEQKTTVYKVAPIISGLSLSSHGMIAGPSSMIDTTARPQSSPQNGTTIVAQVVEATEADVEAAITSAAAAFEGWSHTKVAERAAILRKAADLLEEKMLSFMVMAIREAGKTMPDALNEVREAVDFCRYYAEQAEKHLVPHHLPGPTGESNNLLLRGRGLIVCISPWNFPLAIFLGQVTAALVAGNCVLAKPAEQTPAIAFEAVKLLHQAGIPQAVLQFLPGRGETVGAQLVADGRTAGVMFTGSTDVARLINQTLAKRKGAIVPLIAETGGQNCMLVDSTALAEQVVVDAIQSAFGSTGQRCSALRVLFVQDDIADKVIQMLKGAMVDLQVGDPSLLTTDIGPVIDEEAKGRLQAHQVRMDREAELIYQVKLPPEAAQGSFFAPCAYEIKSLKQLPQEVFGPILHVIRYAANQLDQVLTEINQTGYGLTLGIHSRVSQTIDQIKKNVHVGNVYVNRNMIGAVVGVQPFGGQGLSGTGPKAGGPHYLPRLCHEQSICVNTTAAGGNTTLMSLSEDKG